MRCTSLTIFAFGALVSAMPVPCPQLEEQSASLQRRSSPVPEGSTARSPGRQFAYPSLVDFWNGNQKKTQGQVPLQTRPDPHVASPEGDDNSLSWTPTTPTIQSHHQEDLQDREAIVQLTQSSATNLKSRAAVPPMPYSRDYIQYTWKRAPSPRPSLSDHPTRPASSQLLRTRPSFRWATAGDAELGRRDGVGSLSVEDMISGNSGLAGRKRRGEVSDVVKLRRKDWRLRVKGAKLIEV